MNNDQDERTRKLVWAREHTECLQATEGMKKSFENKIDQLNQNMQFAYTLYGHCIRTMFKK